LALGYISTILPIIIIVLTVYVSNMLLGFYGVGLAGVGVLSGMPIFLAHHLFAPLADNARQMCLIAELGEEAREKTEEMDQVGKSAAARSRTFVVQPAALAGVALFGGYLFNTNLYKISSEDDISITEPLIYAGVLLGAMVPFLFSGIILPTVRKAAS
jgi:Na+/H+-translocating membrane pyrophosphatase